MKEKNKNEKKVKKGVAFYKILSTITLICSIGYFTNALLSVDSILTNIKYLSTPLFIFILAFVLFISVIKGVTKGKMSLIASILLVIFMGFNFMSDINIVKLPQDEKLISYVNTPYKTLSEWANKKDITLDIEYEYSDTIGKGNVIRIDVSEGTSVKDIKQIKVTVSNGPDYDKIVVVPSMVGWNIDDVVNFIKKNNIIGAVIQYQVSEDQKDDVIAQNKNGDIRRDQEFILTVSLGKEEDLPITVDMIDLKGMSLFDSTLWLKRNNIKYTVEYEFNDTIDRNIVLKQNINPKEKVNVKDGSVILTISKGKAITVPDILNMTVEEITNWIVDNKLKVSFSEVYDEAVAVGKVISSSVEKGQKIETNTLITITVSKGQIKMQSFASLAEFKEWANKYNITYDESYEYNSTVVKGGVISYSYNENDIIDPDAVIYIKVSLGKAIVLPSFVGKTKTQATSTCTSLGIRCSFVSGTYTSYAANTVYAQSKSSGVKVASGTTITLTLSKGVPVTKTLYIQQNWLSIGNADATIASLRTQFSINYPGVNFNFIKVKDNTLSSGMISKSSPTNHGSTVKQGNTYTIYIVSN